MKATTIHRFAIGILFTLFITSFPHLSAQKQLTICPARLQCDYTVPEKAETQLRDKMLAAITAVGLGDMNDPTKIALQPSISIVDEHTGAGVQTSTRMTLNYTFSLVNIRSGEVYDTYTFRNIETRGENKINAISRSFRTVELNTPAFLNFLGNAQEKVIVQYERNLKLILAKVKTYSQTNDHEAALSLLMEIPEETPSYSRAVLPAIERTYKSHINQVGAELLQEAKAAWAASPDEEGAEKVSEILSQIPVGSTASADAQRLVKSIEQRLKTLDQRRWAALNRQLAQQHQEKLAMINAARAVAVAYAKRPTKIHVTNVHVW